MAEEQLNNPMHGIKLKDVLTFLKDYYGWKELAELININCFKSNPTLNSCLKFLRKEQWARNKVEDLYLETKEYMNS